MHKKNHKKNLSEKTKKNYVINIGQWYIKKYETIINIKKI